MRLLDASVSLARGTFLRAGVACLLFGMERCVWSV